MEGCTYMTVNRYRKIEATALELMEEPFDMHNSPTLRSPHRVLGYNPGTGKKTQGHGMHHLASQELKFTAIDISNTSPQLHLSTLSQIPRVFDRTSE